MAAGQCSPIRGVFAGAGARWGCCPPPRGCSQEDKLRIRAQLRLGSGNRRTADCWNRTSVEKGTHRRKAPVPVRVCFAGAEACTKFAPPGSHRSTEDKLGIRAQLRPTFACRRRTNIEEPNSVENGAHRRKAPAPVRVCFAVADARGKCCTPVSRRSSEDRLRFRAQHRLTFACRRKTDTEEPNSVENGTHRRKAPAPVKGVSSELVRERNSYLRRALVRRRTRCESALCSG